MFTRLGYVLIAVDHTYTLQVDKSTSLFSDLANISHFSILMLITLAHCKQSLFLSLCLPDWIISLWFSLSSRQFNFSFQARLCPDCPSDQLWVSIPVTLVRYGFWWRQTETTVLTNYLIYQEMTSDLHIIINPQPDPSRSQSSHLAKWKGQLARSCDYPPWPQNVCPSFPPPF